MFARHSVLVFVVGSVLIGCDAGPDDPAADDDGAGKSDAITDPAPTLPADYESRPGCAKQR